MKTGALARTVFSERRRFEIRSDCNRVFALIQKEFLLYFLCNQPAEKVFSNSRLRTIQDLLGLVAPRAAIRVLI